MIIKIKKSLEFGDGSEKKFYAKAGKDIQYQTLNVSHTCCDAYQNIEGRFLDLKVDWCDQNAFIIHQIKTWYRSMKRRDMIKMCVFLIMEGHFP